MSRKLACFCMGALPILFAAALSGWAAEKAPKDSPASAAARQRVEAALKAEAAGDNASRAELLASAIQYAPALPEANWQLEKVHVGGKWLTLAECEQHAASDPLLAEYRKLRDEAGENPKLIRGLAHRCLKNGWHDTAKLHYAQLLTNPAATGEMRAEAIKELDLHAIGNSWITKDEFAARTKTAKTIEAAMERWRPIVKSLQLAIDGDDFKRRDRAIAELKKLDDPALIPVLASFLADGGADFQEEAVKRLATFPHYEATVALVEYAVLSNATLTREAAIAALKQRPMHEFVPLLLGGLTAPVKSQFQINWDAKGRVRYTHEFLREGTSGNVLLVSQGLSLPVRPPANFTQNDTVRVYAPQKAHSTTTTTAIGAPPAVALAQQRAAALNKAAVVESEVQTYNSDVKQSNERLFAALEQTTGEQLQRDPLQWWTWWQGYNEYQWPRPTTCYYQSSAQQYYSGVSYMTHITGTRSTSCFIAGTLVHSQTGKVPIESIQPGDRVLAQNQDTGELTYAVVLRTTIRSPAKMLRISVGEDALVTTLGHPFWVDGHGWKMSKELTTGDLLHSLSGAVRIDNVEPAGEAQAFNLVVDGFNTYFVGRQGLLVHDNEFRKPTRAIVPGLDEELSATAKK